jgi:hypothetical protein
VGKRLGGGVRNKAVEVEELILLAQKYNLPWLQAGDVSFTFITHPTTALTKNPNNPNVAELTPKQREDLILFGEVVDFKV